MIGALVQSYNSLETIESALAKVSHGDYSSLKAILKRNKEINLSSQLHPSLLHKPFSYIHLGQSLKDTSVLKLNLSNNDIHNNNFYDLCEGLKTNQTITCLDLSNNKIDFTFRNWTIGIPRCGVVSAVFALMIIAFIELFIYLDNVTNNKPGSRDMYLNIMGPIIFCCFTILIYSVRKLSKITDNEMDDVKRFMEFLQKLG